MLGAGEPVWRSQPSAGRVLVGVGGQAARLRSGRGRRGNLLGMGQRRTRDSAVGLALYRRCRRRRAQLRHSGVRQPDMLGQRRAWALRPARGTLLRPRARTRPHLRPETGRQSVLPRRKRLRTVKPAADRLLANSRRRKPDLRNHPARRLGVLGVHVHIRLSRQVRVRQRGIQGNMRADRRRRSAASIRSEIS